MVNADKHRVIIFDWDDTLMSSSWAHHSQLLPLASFDSLPSHLQSAFRQFEERVIGCLTAALSHGSVIIITNAEQGWVEYSTERFMPRLAPLLSQIRVVSARSTYERFFPLAPLCWKAAAFAHEANQLFTDLEDVQKSEEDGSQMEMCTPPLMQREILSFGDSNEERTAVRIAAGQLNATPKSIKFVDMPNLEQLGKQVDAINGWMSWLCEYEGSLDLMLKATSFEAPTDQMSNTTTQVDPLGESFTADHPFRPPPMESLVVTS